MANCQNSNECLFGGAIVLEVADGCPDVKPLEDEWKALAAGTSKGFDFNPNAVTSDADDGGGYVESIITNSDFTISFEGEVRKKDKLDQYGIGKFIVNFSVELKARRQPGIWVRMPYGPVTFIGYMVPTGLSSDGGTNDIVTFSTEFKVGDASTIEVIDNAAATAMVFVADLPSTKTAAVGDDFSLGVQVSGGVAPYKYDWYKNGIHTGLSTSTTTIDFDNATTADNGVRQVKVTDYNGNTITSTPNTLTVS
ncbi:immunoglobulin domain-containing protein [Citrobacter freundii complex sp. CFNIH7]|uniref:immunoglobulin domain-containing protein n=1 Tax=Citrobacter freundii complex sp. CFNIH7 TaxID=2080669 RepID=UPI000CDD6019|nr:immunoglobulin domain-containing protein [Citrobacter freundii complex sp. CFNIH7]POU15799.1 hypothetical protein C3368_02020 [Citrobacter freundii complex sp. CFNIH7]